MITRRLVLAGLPAAAVPGLAIAAPTIVEDPGSRCVRLAHELEEALAGWSGGHFMAEVWPKNHTGKESIAFSIVDPTPPEALRGCARRAMRLLQPEGGLLVISTGPGVRDRAFGMIGEMEYRFVW